MSTTTSQLVREGQRKAIEALTPDDLSRTKFEEYTEREDFREWCEKAPAGCLRKFEIEDLLTYELPTVSDYTQHLEDGTFRVTVAYPADARFGADERMGLADSIRADQNDINTAIGLLGVANYVPGQLACTIEEIEIERGENVWFLTMDFRVQYYRPTGYVDNIRIAEDGTIRIVES